MKYILHLQRFNRGYTYVNLSKKVYLFSYILKQIKYIHLHLTSNSSAYNKILQILLMFVKKIFMKF